MKTLGTTALRLLIAIASFVTLYGQTNVDYAKVSNYCDLYDNRGYLKGKALTIDGNLTISNMNLAPQYIYPLHSYQVNQTTVNVTLSYNQNATYHAYVRYNHDMGTWERWEQNRPVWVIGVNGFAVQALHGVVKPLQRLSMRRSLLRSAEADVVYPDTYVFSDDDVQWVLDGYNVGNEMRPGFGSAAPSHDGKDLFIDQINLLRSDGSVLKLVKQKIVEAGDPNVVDSAEFLTGYYAELSTTPNGYAFVEFIPEGELSPHYVAAVRSALRFEKESPIPVRFRPRRLRYFDGTGAAYVFEEWKTPFGLAYMTGVARPNGMDDVDLNTGLMDAFPNVWYFSAIQHQGIDVVPIHRTKHMHGGKLDESPGRANVYSIDNAVKFRYGANDIEVDAMGRKTVIKCNEQILGGKPPYDGVKIVNGKTEDLWLGLIHAYQNSEGADLDWELREDEMNDHSITPLVTSIIDGAGRETKFVYDVSVRKIEGSLFPGGTPTNIKDRFDYKYHQHRITSIVEPSRSIQLKYYKPELPPANDSPFDPLARPGSDAEYDEDGKEWTLPKQFLAGIRESGENPFFTSAVVEVQYVDPADKQIYRKTRHRRIPKEHLAGGSDTESIMTTYVPQQLSEHKYEPIAYELWKYATKKLDSKAMGQYLHHTTLFVHEQGDLKATATHVTASADGSNVFAPTMTTAVAMRTETDYQTIESLLKSEQQGKKSIGYVPVERRTFQVLTPNIKGKEFVIPMTAEKMTYTFQDVGVASMDEDVRRLNWKVETCTTTTGRLIAPAQCESDGAEVNGKPVYEFLPDYKSATTYQTQPDKHQIIHVNKGIDKLASGKAWSAKYYGFDPNDPTYNDKVKKARDAWVRLWTVGHDGLGTLDLTSEEFDWVRIVENAEVIHIVPALWAPVLRQVTLDLNNNVVAGTETEYHLENCFDKSGNALMTFGRPHKTYRLGMNNARMLVSVNEYGGPNQSQIRVVREIGPYQEIVTRDYGAIAPKDTLRAPGAMQTSLAQFDEYVQVPIPERSLSSAHIGVPIRSASNVRKPAFGYSQSLMSDIDSAVLASYAAYDEQGNPIATVDENGVASIATFDGIGRLLKATLSGDHPAETATLADPVRYGLRVDRLLLTGETFSEQESDQVWYSCAPCPLECPTRTTYKPTIFKPIGGGLLTDGMQHAEFTVGRRMDVVVTCQQCEEEEQRHSNALSQTTNRTMMRADRRDDSDRDDNGVTYLPGWDNRTMKAHSVIAFPTSGNVGVTSVKLRLNVINIVGSPFMMKLKVYVLPGLDPSNTTSGDVYSSEVLISGAVDKAAHETVASGLRPAPKLRDIEVDLSNSGNLVAASNRAGHCLVRVEAEYVPNDGDGGDMYAVFQTPSLEINGELYDYRIPKSRDFTVAYAYDDSKRRVRRLVKIDDQKTSMNTVPGSTGVRHVGSLSQFGRENVEEVAYSGIPSSYIDPLSLKPKPLEEQAATFSRMKYNGMGAMINMTDALQNETAYQVDGRGNVQSILYPPTTLVQASECSGGGLANQLTSIGKTKGQYTEHGIGTAKDILQRGLFTLSDAVVRQRFPRISLCETLTYEKTVALVDEQGIKALVSIIVRDAFGNTILSAQSVGSFGDSEFALTSTSYDRYGRVAQMINPDNVVTAYAYDTYGRTRYVFNANNGMTSHAYDKRDRVRFSQTQQQANDNRVSFFQYDDLGRLTAAGEAKLPAQVKSVRDAGVIMRLLESPWELYESAGRYTDILNPDELQTAANREPVTVNRTLYGFSLATTFGTPEMVKIDDPCPLEKNLAMDSRLLSPQNITGKVLRHPSGNWERATMLSPASTFEDGTMESSNYHVVVAYDALPGGLPSLSPLTPRPSLGIWTHFPARDIWERISGTARPFAYQRGRVTAIAYRGHGGEPFHYMVRNYDDRGRLAALLRYTENIGFDAVYYTYNSMNQVTSTRVIDPMHQTVTFTGYDDAGRVSTVRSAISADGFGAGIPKGIPRLILHDDAMVTSKDPDHVVTYSKRNEVEQITTATADDDDNIVTEMNYNERGWLMDRHIRRATSGRVPSGTIYRQTLGYDLAGRIVQSCTKTAEADETRGTAYVYDGLSMLTSELEFNDNGTQHAVNYVYSLGGNRSSMVRRGDLVINYHEDAHEEYTYGNGPKGIPTDQLTKYTFKNMNSTTAIATHTHSLTYDANGSLIHRTFASGEGEAVHRREDFMYNSSGLVERALIRDMGVAGAGRPSSCTSTVDELPADDWRYRYNTSLEREQKRQYSSTMGPGTLLPWTYYILGPDNAQLAVWHGLQGAVCDGTNPTSVRMWPVEYNSYSVGGRIILRPDGRKELVVTNHLGSTVAVVEVSTPTAPVVGQQHTTAYGQPITMQGAVDADRARTGYIGRETDAEHNLG
ncbi:MAG: RHS repeat protein, partial [Candidatus Kapabacteria bacterium]|nr:RHS repeat protein [Candidatus Kapabacteria bacterium]